MRKGREVEGEGWVLLSCKLFPEEPITSEVNWPEYKKNGARSPQTCFKRAKVGCFVSITG